jgi:hypothetical protein
MSRHPAGSLVPALKAELTVKTPAERGPGKPWTQGAPLAQAPDAIPGAAIRIGYTRCSTVGQELQSQLDALAGAQCTRVFSEEISTRVKYRRSRISPSVASVSSLRRSPFGRAAALASLTGQLAKRCPAGQSQSDGGWSTRPPLCDVGM